MPRQVLPGLDAFANNFVIKYRLKEKLVLITLSLNFSPNRPDHKQHITKIGGVLGASATGNEWIQLNLIRMYSQGSILVVIIYVFFNFRGCTVVQIPPLKDNDKWTIGWVQACTSMEFTNTYGENGR